MLKMSSQSWNKMVIKVNRYNWTIVELLMGILREALPLIKCGLVLTRYVYQKHLFELWNTTNAWVSSQIYWTRSSFLEFHTEIHRPAMEQSQVHRISFSAWFAC